MFHFLHSPVDVVSLNSSSLRTRRGTIFCCFLFACPQRTQVVANQTLRKTRVGTRAY